VDCSIAGGREWLMPLALSFVCGAAGATGTATVDVIDADGLPLVAFTVRAEDRWCLVWNHSVAGFPVRDCFVFRPPAMILDSSHQPDFAAGLGHIEGRGKLRSDGVGGYWIEDIDEPVPGNRLNLRVGSSTVDHRIEFKGMRYSLSERAANRLVVMRLVQE
jgi:hypothetical protein